MFTLRQSLGWAVTPLFVAVLFWPVSTLTLTNRTNGSNVGWLPLPATFDVSYRHSIIGQQGNERFQTTRDGIRLVQIISRSGAVIDYYARAERPHETASGYVINVIEPNLLSLPIKVSSLGDRSIRVGDDVVHLARLVPDGDTVELSTGLVPRIAVLISAAMLKATGA